MKRRKHDCFVEIIQDLNEAVKILADCDVIGEGGNLRIEGIKTLRT